MSDIYTPNNPTIVRGLFNSAVQAEEAGDSQRAIAIYEQILSTDAAYPPALINLGSIRYHMGHYAMAEELYRRAMETDPDYYLAVYNLANVLEELGRPCESIALYERALELHSWESDAHFNLARLCQKLTLNEKALRHWKEVLRLVRYGSDANDALNAIRYLRSRESTSIDQKTTDGDDYFLGVLHAPEDRP